MDGWMDGRMDGWRWMDTQSSDKTEFKLKMHLQSRVCKAPDALGINLSDNSCSEPETQLYLQLGQKRNLCSTFGNTLKVVGTHSRSAMAFHHGLLV